MKRHLLLVEFIRENGSRLRELRVWGKTIKYWTWKLVGKLHQYRASSVDQRRMNVISETVLASSSATKSLGARSNQKIERRWDSSHMLHPRKKRPDSIEIVKKKEVQLLC